jgi:transposase-like protein
VTRKVRIARKSDGRRIFTAAFKREHIGRVLRGELTLAELSRKLGIARGLLQRWKRMLTEGAEVAAEDRGLGTRAGGVRATQYIRELQRLVGKQAVELELLRAKFDVLKNERRSPGMSGR